MTPQFILRASLCRESRCFSAHTPGEGYTNRGTDAATRSAYKAQRQRAAESEIDNLGYAPAYANRYDASGDTPRHGILLADWNVFPDAVVAVLEKAGYACEWADEWAQCSDCNRAFRTSPDSYWFHVQASVVEADYLCLDCLQEFAESERENELLDEAQAREDAAREAQDALDALDE